MGNCCGASREYTKIAQRSARQIKPKTLPEFINPLVKWNKGVDAIPEEDTNKKSTLASPRPTVSSPVNLSSDAAKLSASYPRSYPKRNRQEGRSSYMYGSVDYRYNTKQT